MAWLMLPKPIFSDIMMMVGHESPESLLSCMKVCSTWNEMIIQVIWESQTKKKIMYGIIERSWGPDMLPTDEEISQAKWLGDGSLILNVTNANPLSFQKPKTYSTLTKLRD